MTKHLVLGVLSILLAVLTLQRRSIHEFSFEEVDQVARRMAFPSHAAMQSVSPLPRTLEKLTYDDYRKLRWKDEYTIWRAEGLPYQLKFFHRGHLAKDRIDLNTVSPRGIIPLHYERRFFNTSELNIPDYGDIGFAGFRIHHPLNHPDHLDELAVFLGGSYFRAVSKDLDYGLSARGLAINTGIDGVEEEFPRFEQFWVRKPGAFDSQILMWALLSSKSVSGAFQFDIYPGIETVMIVRAKLYIKAPIKRLGVAPLTSMFWYGENTPDANRDWRPEVHDSDGLLLQKATGEWLWRPLDFSRNLRNNRFSEPNVKGFGFLQRDRDFSHYQDLEAKYFKRPSAWVETIRGFEDGAVELVQLPTDNEFTDNVVAFWTPNKKPAKGDVLEFEYRIVWYGNHSDRPAASYAKQTFIEKKENGTRYYIDFAGRGIEALPKEPEAVIITDPVSKVSDVRVEKNENDMSWRLGFTLESPPANVRTVDIRALLAKDQKPITETWTYNWTR